MSTIIEYEKFKNLPSVSGVYIIRRGTAVLYVGSTINFYNRFYYNPVRKKFVTQHNPTSIEYIECPISELAALEAKTIKELLPELNIYAKRSDPVRKRKLFYPFGKESETSSLRDKTIYLLNTRDRQLTLKKISEDTGINNTWLSMLGRGMIPNPGVNFIQALYEYLSKSKLNLD